MGAIPLCIKCHPYKRLARMIFFTVCHNFCMKCKNNINQPINIISKCVSDHNIDTYVYNMPYTYVYTTLKFK